MAYATYEDIQARIDWTMSPSEQSLCTTLLDDAAVLIDSFNANASADAKKIVSCNVVIRKLGDKSLSDIPVGATQGSMSAMGYSQSWTISNGSTGELYLSKTDKKYLGYSNNIGSYSPLQELVPEEGLL